MRLKRLMSIVLTVALVLSFAMSASAGELFYAQDFDAYVGEDISKTTLKADTYANSAISFTGGLSTTHVSATPTWLAEARESGKNIVASTPNLAYQSYTATISKNGLGNNQYEVTDWGNFSTLNMGYILDDTWNAVGKEGKTLVFSMDLNNQNASTLSYSFFTVVGKSGENDANRNVLNSTDSGAMRLTTNDYGSTGTDIGIAVGETKRFALGFNYNSTTAKMEGIATVDGIVKSTETLRHTADLTAIDGFGMSVGSNYKRSLGKIRIYEIDTTEGFKVTSSIDGAKRVPLETESVTLTFTHPVAEATFDDAVYTIKKNGTEIAGGLTAGAIETKVVDGNYVSTVDVTLPTLEMSGEYEISVSGVTNELGTALADSTISFSTPLPDITTGTPVIDTMTIGSMNNASVTISNNTVDTDKKVAVIYAVYTDAGKLVDVVYADDTIAADSSATISAGITLGSDAYKAKVMVWDGLTTVSPFRGFADATVQ